MRGLGVASMLLCGLALAAVARAQAREASEQQPAAKADPTTTGPEEASPTVSQPPAQTAQGRGHPVARRHFERALEWYRHGRYREAAHQLELALKLDPDERDLVYNLGLVYEKLGDLDRAISQYQRLLELERDRTERARVLRALRRVQGARTVQQEQESAACPADENAGPQGPPVGLRQRPSPAPSRVDGWVIATASTAAVGTVAAVVLGVSALLVHPGAQPETSQATSVDRLQAQADTANSLAIAADISLSIAVVSGAGAVALYLARDPAADHGSSAALGGRPFGVVGVCGRF